MIADIYKCPHCGCNVYLAQDEDECPLCNDGNRSNMELVELGVDLQFDKDCGEHSRYANFKHMAELLRIPYGDRSGLYLMDCWKYAWNPELVDSANIDKVVDFINDPNESLFHKEPMTREEFMKEVERIINKIIRKCECVDDNDDVDNYDYDGISYNSYSKQNCKFRLYVRKDLSDISADMIYKFTQETIILNYAPVDEKKPVPLENDNNYFVISGTLGNACCPRERFDGAAKKMARLVTDYCFSVPFWKEACNILKYHFLWRNRPFNILY